MAFELNVVKKLNNDKKPAWFLVATIDGYSQQREFHYKNEAQIAKDGFMNIADPELNVRLAFNKYFQLLGLRECADKAKLVTTVECPACHAVHDGWVMKTAIIRFGMCTDCRQKRDFEARHQEVF